jgi:hypothetical protein
MLRSAVRRMQSGISVPPAELASLQRECVTCHQVLGEQVRLLVAQQQLHIWGPFLAGMEDAVAAVNECAPESLPAFGMTLRNTLLLRGRFDGHFISGISIDDAKENRGDNTFGTATSVMTLMLLDDLEGKILPAPSGR